MNAIKHILLGLFLFGVLVHIADCQESESTEGYPPVKRTYSLPGLIRSLLSSPIKLIEALLKLPVTIITRVVNILSQIAKELNTVGSTLSSDAVSLIRQLVGQILDVLISVGVLQGKTTEDVVGGIQKVIEKVITFVINLEMTISSTVVGLINNIFSGLNIQEIIERILSLPLIKQIFEIIKNIWQFISINYSNQIKAVQDGLKAEYEKHIDFFQPIFDGVSSRILIIFNALQALVNGKLDECRGMISINDTPPQGLKWQIDVVIFKLKTFVLKIAGFEGWANKTQDKVDDLLTGTTFPPGTAFPPITTTLGL